MNQVKDEFKERLKNLEIQLDMLEKQTTFNELDMQISKAEISKAISKLKYGKSPGLDNTSTNMLKCAQNELLPSIEKLFNSCLSSGNYPNNWAVGYITPIHKAGDI
jgi:hypothetical protein